MNTKLENVKQPKLTQPSTAVDKKAMNLPASWYIAMHSKALGKKPLAIKLFGQPLVAWRDQKDHAVIMERYCSHMGASLAIGKVVDGCIQCPFHHWRFDNSGQCVDIPDVDYIPPKARQATYVTVERYGYIWVWYGSQTPLFPLPEFPAAEADRHKYMSMLTTDKTKTTVLSIVENTLDYYHITTIHGLKVSGPIQVTLLNDQYSAQLSEAPIPKEAWLGALIEYPINNYVGPLGKVIQALGLDGKTFTLRVDAWPSGQVTTGFVDGEERLKLLMCTTPIDENKTIQEVLAMVKKTGNFWLDILYYVAFGWQTKIGAGQDLPLWEDINPEKGGVHVKYDLGVLKFRNLYQNWVDRVE